MVPDIILSIFQLIYQITFSIGSYMLLKKSGRKGWYGLIPGLREYQLAVAAEHEEEGRIFFILTACFFVSNLIFIYFNEGTILYVIFAFLTMSLQLSAFFYSIRIYLALCRLYQRPKRWIILWAIIPSLATLIWGFNKNFQPEHKSWDADEIDPAKESGATLEAIKKGLTVNLASRSVVDFFKKRYLLKDIHLSIPTGHMVLLLGGSGAGKTTFLNALTGYEKAKAEVLLNGSNVYNNYDSMKYDLGFVPQQDLMRNGDTVNMTLMDAAKLRLPKQLPSREKSNRISAVLEKFGLSSVKHNLVEKLSGGQRKRLSIAMEFISDPTLFILDEPDSGLDGIVARNLFKSLRSIADEGKIVIVITHTPDRVIDLFDDVIVLAKDAGRTGRLAYYGSVKESYDFFGKKSMEDILLTINQTDEGGEGRSDEFIEKYAQMITEKAG